jgi:hypothetical protein
MRTKRAEMLADRRCSIAHSFRSACKILVRVCRPPQPATASMAGHSGLLILALLLCTTPALAVQLSPPW